MNRTCDRGNGPLTADIIVTTHAWVTWSYTLAKKTTMSAVKADMPRTNIYSIALYYCYIITTPHPHTLSLRSQHTVCIIRVYALFHYVSAVSLQWFHPVHLGYKYRVCPLVNRPDLNIIIPLHLWDWIPSFLSHYLLWIWSYYTIVVSSILFRAYHPILVCSTSSSGTLPLSYEGHSAPSERIYRYLR